MLNPNIVTPAQLMGLPGVTAAMTNDIITNRPYAVTADLSKAGFIPAAALAQLAVPLPPVVVKPPTKISVGASPLVISKGGVYSGTASLITVIAGAAENVVIDRMAANNCIANTACNLTVTNSTFTNPFYATDYGLAVWRCQNLAVENNLFNGTRGIIVRDFGNAAKTLRIRYNRGVNISGATSPTHREKISFIQLFKIHVPDGEIAWNWLQNIRGQSATEDAIALAQAGGTPGCPFRIHDNFIDGIFNWPVGGDFSGSGIMAFDPTAGTGLTIGGYTEVFNNVVLDSENKAYAMAGSHDISIHDNRAIKDGTGSTIGTVGSQIWNWGVNAPATPPELFANNTKFFGNFSYWLIKGKRFDFSINHKVDQTGASNVAGVSSEAAERSAYAARVAGAGVVIGPKP